MRYDQLFTKLFCQPILCEPSFRAGLEMALIALMRGEIPETPPMVRKLDPERSDQRASANLELRGQTAIIHLDGALDKNLSGMDRISLNATDLRDVDQALAKVAAGAANGSLKNLMLAIDSPGGTFPGLPETASRISALDKKMNVAAYLDNGCSAAYWIAAQASQVFGAPSSSSGSVGVYTAILDKSKMLEDLGIRVETFQSGNLKTAGVPWKPLSESEKEYLQARTAEIGKMFTDTVQQNRPNIASEDLEGQTFLGASALEKGFIDNLAGSLDEAIARAF